MPRSRIRSILPVLLIAWLVQIFAPVAATTNMAASIDPLAGGVICGQFDPDHGTSAPAGVPVSHDECCNFCSLASAGASPIPVADIALTVADVVVATVAWLPVDQADRAAAVADAARARAPPLAA